MWLLHAENSFIFECTKCNINHLHFSRIIPLRTVLFTWDQRLLFTDFLMLRFMECWLGMEFLLND